MAHDVQRDRVYTDQLAGALCEAYQRDNVVLPTHLAAFAGWHTLGRRYPNLDVYNRALLAPFERWVDRADLLVAIEHGAAAVERRVAEGRTGSLLPEGDDRAERILNQAVRAFECFHSRRGLSFEDWRVLVDPKLCLYYGNRLSGILSPIDLE